ncbi:putative LRR receptor-like serine/threonine-protein kinase [Senna tora]|uniref:Putative LRR receptor-like serine/threonine-protein kinase n=1 Tax=Senna tora TaxID=362788 RepID=A0A834XFI7_9FABA|nr:putative LRR receptor-like serine/threonine-protein kinase [Senna tora]
MGERFLFAVIQLSFTLTVIVHAQDPTDFISIDCGLGGKQTYVDKATGLNYTSDDKFIDTGKSHSISPEYKAKSLEKQFWNVRSFPVENRNCYSFNAPSSADTGFTQYIVRARFMYGNYDGKNSTPIFDIYLGNNKWDSVEFENASTIVTKEILYTPISEYIHVCLCNIHRGTPFISVLELRPIINGSNPDASYELFARFDISSQDGKIARYPEDPLDRIWTPYNSIDWTTISAPLEASGEYDSVPSRVMRTAATPANGSDSIYFKFSYNASVYYLNLYLAEVQKHGPNQTREFNIFIDGVLKYSNFQPQFLKTPYPLDSYNYTNSYGTLDVLIKRTNRSTLPPILNAIEMYIVRDTSQRETNKREYDALKNIKSTYNIKRNWQGDPCLPKDYMWEGLNCSNVEGSGNPRITSLNLSSSGLSGKITSDIFTLESIEYLDLSNNNLIGEVSDVLSRLNSLKVLKLEGNHLSGTIPPKLLDRWEKAMNFSVDVITYFLLTLPWKSLSMNESCRGNPNLCCPGSCNKEIHKVVIIIIIVASLVGAFLVFAAIAFWIFKRRQPAAKSLKKPSLELTVGKGIDSNKQQFSYEEVKSITSNFGRELGKGGFGTVFLGYIGKTQVAVKMLSPSSHSHWYLQFQAEAELLTTVHHKCLTALIGYCDDGTNVALIYEYMANGDLADHLSGLEYLHNGCKPPIVHRDIKPQNILLNENMRAKLGDFGLSRIFSNETDTHISTVIAGTFGYLDPEYYLSNKLNEKSDIYSFGIVLLEILTGRPAIFKNEERDHITHWLDSMAVDREINDIVDSRLHGEFDIDSARKFLDTAMACVASTSIDRPTMSQVLMELKQCMGMVITPVVDAYGNIDIPSCMIDVSFEMISGQSSLAR